MNKKILPLVLAATALTFSLGLAQLTPAPPQHAVPPAEIPNFKSPPPSAPVTPSPAPKPSQPNPPPWTPPPAWTNPPAWTPPPAWTNPPAGTNHGA